MGQELRPSTVGHLDLRETSYHPATALHSFRAHRSRVVHQWVCGHQHSTRWPWAKSREEAEEAAGRADKIRA